ncbi:tellurite resistance TerB family protein [Cyanobium sp. Morenito 9A2]|uniref:tellurite resistance TerB family protein n=1 Tax=Cyanobium sp. Morenito 9A2 TaxID=2823718 RepID=UPI0020CF1377|nr:tellurite resistance TerB family protein [Cyanobium sp. Morenito 9A2]MCP9850262.1 tellurite resistance TerB family protein [Cyanobium sp. Morenito 9A2]
MDPSRAFAAVALAAVAWDGVMSRAGARALRHALDYRPPYNEHSDQQMLALLNELLESLKHKGAEALLLEACGALDGRQRLTAFAMTAEIMRSDGPLLEEERRILDHLSLVLELSADESEQILQVMDILHAGLLEAGLS